MQAELKAAERAKQLREDREKDSFKFEGTWADESDSDAEGRGQRAEGRGQRAEGTWADESDSDAEGRGPLDLAFLSPSYQPNRLDWESKKPKRNQEY